MSCFSPRPRARLDYCSSSMLLRRSRLAWKVERSSRSSIFSCGTPLTSGGPLPRAPNVSLARESQQEGIDSKMVRYRYGPWDPAYFALLGALIGRGLVESVPSSRGFSYRSTESGRQVAEQLRATDAWGPLSTRTRLLKRHFDLTGNFLKRFIYQTFPEVTSATWGDEL